MPFSDLVIYQRKRLSAVAIAAFGFAAMVLSATGMTPALADSDMIKPGVITLEGVGEVSGRADMAIITTGVVSEAKTAREALNSNTKAMSDVIEWLKKNDIASRDIQTSGFSVQPRYTQVRANSNGERPPPRIVGYAVSNQVTIRIRNIENLGIILDHVVSSGSNRINGINFTFSKMDEMLDRARTNAMKDAMRKAGIYSQAANVELGRITMINELGGYRPQPQMMGRAYGDGSQRACPL